MKKLTTLFALFAMLILLSCGNNQKNVVGNVDTDQINSTPLTDVVEVVFFHNHERCQTCIKMERIIVGLVNNNFKSQIEDGTLVFKVVDINDRKNSALIDNYGVVWTSLYINKWENGVESRNNMTEFSFLYIDSSPEVFESGIINKIKELLE